MSTYISNDAIKDNSITKDKLLNDISNTLDLLLEGLKDPEHVEDPFVRGGVINIPFKDERVKRIVTEKYGTNGELSYELAKSVTQWALLFTNNTNITEFPEFRYFENLQGIEEGGNWWDPGLDGSFSGCTNLTNIELPPNMMNAFTNAGGYNLGNKMFYGCTNLKLTKLPDDWTFIPYAMFRDCTSLNLAYLPPNLTTIKQYAFMGCTSLALTELPDSVTSIESCAFLDCKALKIAKLPPNLTTLNGSAFLGCSAITIKELPDSLTNLTLSWTFNGCTNIALTKLPDYVTSIDWYAFNGCTNLALTSLPPNLEKLGGFALLDCPKCNITSIPETLKEFDEHALRNCGGISTITELNLPNLESVGWNSFDSFTSLQSITLGATPPNGGTWGFNSTCIIYVPDDAVDTYKEATNWKDLADRIRPVSEKTS